MTTLTTHQRELLQAALDGKELVGVVSGTHTILKTCYTL